MLLAQGAARRVGGRRGKGLYFSSGHCLHAPSLGAPSGGFGLDFLSRHYVTGIGRIQAHLHLLAKPDAMLGLGLLLDVFAQ